LSVLDLQVVGGLLIVKSAKSTRAAPLSVSTWFDGYPLHGLTPLGRASEIGVKADWKVLVEQWLESAPLDGPPGGVPDSIEWTLQPAEGTQSLSSRLYRQLAGSAARGPWRERFIAPNQLLEWRPDGLSILQAVPSAAGRCRLRQLHLTLCAPGRRAHALQYVAARLESRARRPALETAESVQKGIMDFGYRASATGSIPPAVLWFRRYLTIRVPALALPRPPNES
jgi:hypothetical protein